jgi:VWFA-related protein
MRAIPAVLALCTALVSSAGAQDSAAGRPDHSGRTPTISSTSTLVIVPTLVRSESGELIQTLQSSDFKLFDNGAEQRVSLEEVERQPLAVVVLMQTGGAAQRQFAAYADLGTMLDSMMGNSAYRLALATFDSEPETLWDFAPGVDDLKKVFAHPEPGDHGAAVLDAVNYGIDLLSQQPANERRILLLLSQTHDDGSKARSEDVVRRLGESNVTLYSVTFSPEKTWLKDQFTQPRHENPLYQMAPNLPPLLHTFDLGTPLGMAIKGMRTNAASEVASLSGGESMEFGDKRDLEQHLAALANDIPARYMLSFRPTSNEGGLHSLEVRVPNRPELKIAARTSYWSAPTPAP